MPRRRPQVLPEGEDVHPRGPQVPHRLNDLVLRFPEPEHDGGFREDVFPHPLRALEDSETLAVARAAVSDCRLEAFHRFDIVVQDIDAPVDHRPDRFQVTLEIGDERFNDYSWGAGLDLPHRASEMC